MATVMELTNSNKNQVPISNGAEPKMYQSRSWPVLSKAETEVKELCQSQSPPKWASQDVAEKSSVPLHPQPGGQRVKLRSSDSIQPPQHLRPNRPKKTCGSFLQLLIANRLRRDQRNLVRFHRVSLHRRSSKLQSQEGKASPQIHK